MQRGTVAPPDPGSTATWAEKSRRRHHPSGGDPDRFTTWRTGSDARLRELLALPMDIAAGTDERLIIDGPEAAEIGAAEDSAAGDRAAEDGAVTGTGGDETVRLITLTTGGAEIPCWLLTPPTARRLELAVVAVAGHGGGIDDLVAPPGNADFHGGLAHKLVAAGLTVLCPEMISFGRRRTPLPATAPAAASSCQVDAMRGLLTGRPVLGRRVSDTLAAVRALRTLPWVDPARVSVIGGSGGGAVALLAAALDEQIPAAVVATFLSSFADSFGAVPHCICNAVPELLTWFEMADVAALIAPRRLIIEAGRNDPIFPVAATEATHAELVDVWRVLGADPPALVITDAAHQFRADDAIALLRHHLSTPSDEGVTP